jgi:glycosyltransferase involved in cell wall biosynthesis
MPRLTVLMPVYNGQRYLREAVESILRQTFSDFEFLIVDDGSQDGTSAILRSYRDDRIRVIENGCNLGLIATLNKGLQMARGQYVARMDADDVSLPRRLERQLDYLEQHRDICVASSYYRDIDENRCVIKTCRPETRDFLISFKMHVEGHNPICHPAAMFRTRPVRDAGGYNSEFPCAEDAALWFRLESLGMKFGVVPRILFLYRCHSQQITRTKIEEMARSHCMAHAQYLSYFLGEPLGIEDVRRLPPCRSDEKRIRDSADLEALLLLKRRIALRFFEAAKLGRMRIVACVAYLWDSLLCFRGLEQAPAGYVRHLLRYCSDVLCQGLHVQGRIRTTFWRGILLASVTKVFLRKGFARIRKRTRQPTGADA